jgi:uncharacterized membrane protein YsdA (DUF1294 family)
MLQDGIYVKIFLFYLVVINFITFVAFVWDKRLARRKARRIAETTLISLAALGGTVGGLLGMYLFHHKTRHIKFKWGLPSILILQAALLYYFLTR